MDTSIPFEAIVPPGIKIPVIESEFPKTRIAVFNPFKKSMFVFCLNFFHFKFLLIFNSHIDFSFNCFKKSLVLLIWLTKYH